ARALDHIAEAARRVAPQSRLGRRLAGDGLDRHATMAQLRALAEFAEAGSFSAAARAMGVTEPAVQRAAREIERLLGAPLFDGANRALRLTPAGETVAALAGRAIKEIGSAFDELREREGRYDGRLVIGTLPLARTRLVPEAVAALIGRHPQARIEIIDGAYSALVRSLRNGSCDLIVGALRETARPAGLTEIRLFDDSLAIVARAGHPLAGRPVAPGELSAHPWVLPRRDTPARAVFDRLDAQSRIADPARGHVETGSLVALRGVLIASDAVSIISPRQIDHELRQGLLVLLDLALPDTARPIGISMLDDWRPTALGADFLECLRRAAE
ncbi:MAG: LysR substrate-binding domain-containing protein, partial [Gemmobacter sp.]|nr:LysR substrate-binding domain-containing protein [Gemmobacter sp.]